MHGKCTFVLPVQCGMPASSAAKLTTTCLRSTTISIMYVDSVCWLEKGL